MKATEKNVATATSENNASKMASETPTADNLLQSIPLHKDTAMMLEAMKQLERCCRLTCAALEETKTNTPELINTDKLKDAQEALESFLWDITTIMMLEHTRDTEMKDYLAAL